MDDRLSTLLSLKLHEDQPPVEVQKVPPQQRQTLDLTSQSEQARGWRLLHERTGWRSCPIGVYVSASESVNQ